MSEYPAEDKHDETNTSSEAKEHHSGNDATRPQYPNAEPDPSKVIDNLLKKMRLFIGQRWAALGREENSRRFTFGIFLATAIYAVFAYLQWDATRRSADAAVKAANAAKESAQIAKEALRPYLSIEEIKIVTFEPDKPILFWIVWKNDGNSPTTISKSIRWLGISPDVPTMSSCINGNDLTQRLVVTPHNTRPQSVETQKGQFRPDQIADVINGDQYFWFCGQVVYTSLEREDSFPLCSYYTSKLKVFRDCKAN